MIEGQSSEARAAGQRQCRSRGEGRVLGREGRTVGFEASEGVWIVWEMLSLPKDKRAHRRHRRIKGSARGGLHPHPSLLHTRVLFQSVRRILGRGFVGIRGFVGRGFHFSQYAAVALSDERRSLYALRRQVAGACLFPIPSIPSPPPLRRERQTGEEVEGGMMTTGSWGRSQMPVNRRRGGLSPPTASPRARRSGHKPPPS